VERFRNSYHRALLLVLALAVAGPIGCTRKAAPTSAAKITLDLSSITKSSKVGALESEIEAIILNVTVKTSAGPQVIYRGWSGHDFGASTYPSPEFFLISDLQSGTAPLIQVLVVKNNETTGGMTFHYGKAQETLSGAEQTVTVPIAQVGSSVADGDGQIAGRYLTGSNVGPTGRLNIQYNPGDGTEMLIQRVDIINGWFRAFALEDVAMSYRLPDGTMLFGKPVSLTTAGVLTGDDPGTGGVNEAAANLRVRIPAHYGMRGSDSDPRELRGAARGIFGFFGPGATGKKICYDNTNMTIPYAYVAASGSTVLDWAPTAASPDSNDVYIEVANGATPIRGGVVGSTPDSTGLCTVTSQSRFQDYLSVNHTQIAHHDSALAFHGAFQEFWSGSALTQLDFSYSSSTIGLTWKYLPGTITESTAALQIVSGADVFVRVLPDGSSSSSSGEDDFRSGMDDGVACNRLTTIGFQKIGTELIGDATDLDHTLSIPIASTPWTDSVFTDAETDGRVQTIVCAFKQDAAGKIYWNEAAVYRQWGCSGCGGGGAPAKIGLSGNLVINDTKCSNAEVVLFDSSDNWSDSSQNTGVNINVSGSSGLDFELGGCGGSTIGSIITIPSGQNSAKIGIRPQSGSNGSYSFDDGGALTDLAGTIKVVPASAPTGFHIENAGGGALQGLVTSGTGSCKPLKVISVNSDGNSTNVNANIGVSLVAPAGVAFYSDSGCSSAISTIPITSGAYLSSPFYVKATTDGWKDIKVQYLGYSDGQSYDLVGTHGTQAAGPLVPLYFTLEVVDGAPTPIACEEIKIVARNGGDVVTNAPETYSGIEINLVSGSGALHVDNTCTSGSSVQNVNITSGFSQTAGNSLFYYSPGGSSTFRIDYTTSGNLYMGGGGQINY
jgi:hypothetical protein